MGLRKEYIPTTLLDQHNTSTLLILYLQVISVIITSYQRNFSLQEMETIIENHN